MAGFPPAKGNSNSVKGPNGNPVQINGIPASTGNGGLKASLKIKSAGIVPSPGVEKNVNLS